jgi:predicted NBD/HSP70 family sugar kinase
MRLSSHVSNVSAHQRSGLLLLELGGTKAVYTTTNGNKLAPTTSFPTPKASTPKQNAQQAVDKIVDVAVPHFNSLTPEQLKSELGLMACAPGDWGLNEQGDAIAKTAGNMNWSPNFNFSQAVREKLAQRGIQNVHQIPIIVTNDQVPAAWAVQGAKRPVVAIIGTGVGAGVGQVSPDGSVNFVATETGHKKVAGVNSDTLEDTISGPAIAKNLQSEALKNGFKNEDLILGIPVKNLYSANLDSKHYDETTRRYFASNEHFAKIAPHMIESKYVQSNLSKREKAIMSKIEKDLYEHSGKWIASLMLTNPGTDKVVLIGSVAAFLDKQRLAQVVNEQIGDKMAHLKIKDANTFFDREDPELVYRGLANMGRHALAKTQKAVQNQVQDLPKESGMGAWHVVGGVLAGAVLGFLAHMLTAPKKTPDANTASTTPTENKPDSSTRDSFTKS